MGLTSRDSKQVTPAELLAAARHHWTIENQVHWARDVTGKEEVSHVRTGAAPRVLASFRNAEVVEPEEEKRNRLPTPRFGICRRD